ncbi:hypothetical protein KC957_04380, partial [Candidatus Saccharibacteria bacterium]|nr:hypothetical protein [Candidatus Saccharibacteria bacterium]
NKYSRQSVVRKATLPIADSLNAALDTMKHMKGRFRFYDPYTTTGHAPGAQFVGGVSLGLAPFAGPMTGRFFHDAADHPFGYIFIDAMDVGCIRERGHGLLSTGLELTDPDGTLDKASEGSAFAGAVDQLSSYLNRPVRFGDKPFSAAIDVAADFGAIHHGEERKLVNTTISTPFRTVMQLTPSGLGGALRAIHNQYREYS